ncbi:hypothetical protein GWK26_08695 [haloarchaeon 3A1-DGR]|nr:hypothetical protein GWK26_08695 [haloarchaeon 3A1-DGR]
MSTKTPARLEDSGIDRRTDSTDHQPTDALDAEIAACAPFATNDHDGETWTASGVDR